jgi:hypothetical protein
MEAFTALMTKGDVAIGREPSFVLTQPMTKFKRLVVEVMDWPAVVRFLLR